MKFAVDYLEDLKRRWPGSTPPRSGKPCHVLKEARDCGRMVFVLGNGGSAASPRTSSSTC